MAKLGVRAYARHRKCSHVAVLTAIKSGRLVNAVTRDGKGRPQIDVAAADAEWSPGVKEIFKAALTGKPGDQSKAPPAADPAADEDDDASPAQTPADLVVNSLGRSKAIRENYLARIAKLDYESRIGKVVDAEQVKERWLAVASIVRQKVLGIPSKAKQRSPDMTADQYAVLELICREALEELRGG